MTFFERLKRLGKSTPEMFYHRDGKGGREGGREEGTQRVSEEGRKKEREREKERVRPSSSSHAHSTECVDALLIIIIISPLRAKGDVSLVASFPSSSQTAQMCRQSTKNQK